MATGRRGGGSGIRAGSEKGELLGRRETVGAFRNIQIRRAKPLLRVSLLLAATLANAGCGVGNFFFGGGAPATGNQRLTGFIGGVVADEPRAALVGRDVLANGGNAADAAVATGFALAVTLPSRASLGAGGACLAYNPSRNGPGGGKPEAILFTSVAPANPGPGSDRPAAVPMLARGLYALLARYGSMTFEPLITPAEQMARFGIPASRALVRDLSTVGGALLVDPNARAIFGPTGTPLTEGANLIQPDLGATLAQLRVEGVGDLYQGLLARRLEQASRLAGGAMTLTDLRNALPRPAPPIFVPAGRDSAAFLPPPADGGLAAAAAFQVLRASPSDLAGAQARAIAVAARWRAAGGDPNAVLAAPAEPGSLPDLPASTTFATLDRNGLAVVCSISMNNLFGTGRIVPGLGILLAASPASLPLPLLSAAMVWNDHLNAFRAEVGGSGQEGAPMAVADGLINTLRSNVAMPEPVPDPGRANVIACSRYLPDAQASCKWATDPRGAGLAVGGG
jgi:gamma-glutamyltranspeptidase/glutathione hydrolase